MSKKSNTTSNTVANINLNLKKASDFLGVDPHYLRKLVREGKIEHSREFVPGTKIERIVISTTVLQARKAIMAERAEKLPEGYRRFIFRGPIELVETFIKEHPEAKDMFALANPGKAGEVENA